MKSLFLALAVASLVSAGGCARLPKPGPVRAPERVLHHGWNFLETEKELLGMDAGVDPVSFSAPVLVGERLVFGSERFGVVVLNRKNGRELWRQGLDGGVLASPVVSGSAVFVGTETGSLYSLDLAGGRELWKTALSGPVHGTPLLAFQRLFVGTEDQAVHAVDPGTGKVLWTYRRPGFGGTSVRGGGSPAAIDGRIWLGFADGSLLSLNPETGGVESEKQYRDNLKFTDIDARVVGWRDGILVSTYDGRLRYLRKDGSAIWEFRSGGANAPLLGEGDVLYFPSSDGAVYALSGNSGKELWSYPLRRGVPTGLALMRQGGRRVLVVAGSEETVTVLDAATGQRLDQSSLGRGSGSYAAVAADPEGGRFYVLSLFSRVHEFRLRL